MATLSRPPTDLFIQAAMTFLNVNDATSMEKFRTRLQPFRIETRQVAIGSTTISVPNLVLEDELRFE